MQFFCVTRRQTPDAKLKTPDASQWNIGCVGSLALGLCVGHVHFIFFVLISFASDTRHKPVFQWNMGLRLRDHVFQIVPILHEDHINMSFNMSNQIEDVVAILLPKTF